MARVHQVAALAPAWFVLPLTVLVWWAAHDLTPERRVGTSAALPYVVAALQLVVLAWGLIQLLCTSFELTTVKLNVRRGWIVKHHDQVLLSKVEAFAVTQGPLGRAFGYGTVVITGTGGTQNRLRGVVDPLSFREACQTTLEQQSRT